MTIILCPQCADSVRLPDGASRSATVRCPLCQEEYPLAAALDKLPPTLIVISDPEAAELTLASLDSGTAVAAAAPAFVDLEGVGAFSPAMTETDAARRPSGAASRRRPVATRKRKPKNPAVEAVKVILGGVAGLAIAQVILWWMGSWKSWPRQRADMFELGPKVARFAPWAVPARYQIEKGKTDADNADDHAVDGAVTGNAIPAGQAELPTRTFLDPDAARAQAVAAKKKSSRSRARNAAAGMKAEHGSPILPDGITFSPSGGSEAGMAAEADDVPLDDTSLDDLTADMASDDRSIENPDVAPVATPPGSAGDGASSAESLRNVPHRTAAELQAALGESRTVLDALKSAPEADIRPLLRQAYAALAKLGEVAAFYDGTDATEAQAAAELVRDLESDPQKLNTLGRAAGGWLKAASRDNDGVLLVGTVAQTRKQGKYQVIELTIPGSDDRLDVYTDAAAEATYSPGARLVVLGAVLSDPSRVLEGYDGDAPVVVWQGVAEQLATP